MSLSTRVQFLSPSLVVACSLLASACSDRSSAAAVPLDAGAADGSLTEATPQPFTIGDGFKPGVAVDAAGTAYIAWYGPETGPNTLQFCRLPRGAKGCDKRATIAALGTTLTRPVVSVSGSTVRVVSYRYGLAGATFDVVYLFTSGDGGATFDVGRQIATTPYVDAVQGPGATFSMATDAYSTGEVFQNAPIDAVEPSKERAVLSTDHPYSGSVGLVDAQTPLVVFSDGSGNAQFRRYVGSGALNDVTNWSPAQDIGHAEYMHLAGGPRGLFLSARTAANTVEVRKFDGKTFGAGVSIPDGTGEIPQSHLAQDASGHLHLVWPTIAADGIRFYYATSDDGVAWTDRRVLTSADAIGNMRVVAAPDQVAVAVWEGPNASVRFISLGVLAAR